MSTHDENKSESEQDATQENLKRSVTIDNQMSDPEKLHAKYEMQRVVLQGVADEQADEVKKVRRLLEFDMKMATDSGFNSTRDMKDDDGSRDGDGMGTEKRKKMIA